MMILETRSDHYYVLVLSMVEMRYWKTPEQAIADLVKLTGPNCTLSDVIEAEYTRLAADYLARHPRSPKA